ncbi:PEP-CTERM sorting domain-containing protein [Cephaloticoccus primus]|uniref:PEP-CTERM sorting domain-containing protein n=1 Tax=Cephaloticoccus primus TaxID=1548207 RepID=UPI0012E77D94|nr:PEP-CTERM sorting domain-containing protein [Cephaloticoccus primus]
MVTLKRGSIGFIEYNNRSITNTIHQIRVEKYGIVNFGRPSLRGDAQRFLYLDDLIISDGGTLAVRYWKEGRDFLLVRKDSAHLNDALKKMEFEGYDRNAIHLVNYNKDYWSISSTPEPSTCGAIFGVLGLGVSVCRRKQGVFLKPRHNAPPRANT